LANRIYKAARNLVDRNFNRDVVAVCHIVSVDADDFANKTVVSNWHPLCGDTRLSLSLAPSIEPNDLVSGTAVDCDEVCSRCLKSMRSNVTPDANHRRHLQRKQKKQTWHTAVVETYLKRCPTCESLMNQQKDILGDYKTRCPHCEREWTFHVSVKSNRNFFIWGYSSQDDDFTKSGIAP
jgi:hypothetical protein